MTKEDDNNKDNKKNKNEIKKYEPHLNCNFTISFMEKSGERKRFKIQNFKNLNYVSLKPLRPTIQKLSDVHCQ